jgi:2-amino-4-hydroxy-6-hydroxymethyldihydropteridine diphosphokinase
MILVALGSNLFSCGKPPAAIIPCAISALARVVKIVRKSRLYLSPAWPLREDPPFINAVVSIETGLTAASLLAALQGVEAGFRRRRTGPNAARTLDLDLIDYHGAILTGASLILPHPGVLARDFVLAPILDVAPAWRHPVTGEGVQTLLGRLAHVTARPLAEA